MVAPVDSKVEVEVEDEAFTLRLNFRSISLLEDAGLDLFSPEGFDMTLARSAIMCRCLAITDHPAMADDEALAIVTRAGQSFGSAVLDLIARFGGKPDESTEGKAPAPVKRLAAQRRKSSSSNGAKPV